ncbi:hypothetical protein FRC08_013332 [Ceratobasidium sp. 394]|nr:hypothetical protein FRC08_013332 [Ceratobasidium sp. 394]
MANDPRGLKAHPVYLSIGNISKGIRRRTNKHAMVVVGYMPVESFEDVKDDETRRQYRQELLHRSLEKIFEPLKKASADGMLAWCADGYLRHIYPVIAAWLADYPEQNAVACTIQSGCPKCTQKFHGRGQGGRSAPLRDQDATLKAFQQYQRTGCKAGLKRLGLRACVPFWADIPHVDIGTCLAPDLLHQLYKGMFERTRDWVEELLGTEEFNRRFKTMPQAQDLRHFKKGVTTVKTWAGRESRDMMRQFLPVVIDAQAPVEFVQLIRALLDFSYLAHGAQLTDVDLAEMDKALAAFHKAKRVLVKEEIVLGNYSFDYIAKLHMLGHYPNDIRELGTPDGYSTETPEHLHIVYVKMPYRASNRRDPLPQIVTHVQRLDAIRAQRTLIDEFYGERPERIEKTELYGDDEDETKGEAKTDNTRSNEDDKDDNEETVQVESDTLVGLETPEIYYP